MNRLCWVNFCLCHAMLMSAFDEVISRGGQDFFHIVPRLSILFTEDKRKREWVRSGEVLFFTLSRT